jgi:hypothetical protein
MLCWRGCLEASPALGQQGKRPGSLRRWKNSLMPHRKLSARSYLRIGSTEAGTLLEGLDPLLTGRLFAGVASSLRRAPPPSSGPPWNWVPSRDRDL